MSNWLDISGSANNFKRSYFHGFVDVSGGQMNLRNDGRLEFYNTADQLKFSINRQNMKFTSYDSNGAVSAIETVGVETKSKPGSTILSSSN